MLIMEPDLLSVTPADLNLSVDDDHSVKPESADEFHTLTSGQLTMASMDGMDTSQTINNISTFPSEILSSDIERDGEITLHSSLIPDNAILMETPRGLMLTVPDGISYGDISPSDSGGRQMLSCVPVSFFKTCDVNGDGESSIVGDDVSLESRTDESMHSQLEHSGSVISTITEKKNNCGDDEIDIQTIQIQEHVQDGTKAGSEDKSPVKRKGGWPKGKKRKIQPEVSGPRAPVTGYVLYAIDRRKEIKQLHPNLAFTEVTKVLGQEWSTMPASQKEKFLEAAEKDKKRYRKELKAFRSSEAYQESMKKKLLQEGVDSAGLNCDSVGSLVIDDENSNELHCKLCNVYFSSTHNKQEHMYGKTHLNNVTEVVIKDKRKQQEQSLLHAANASEQNSALHLSTEDLDGIATSSESSTIYKKQSGPVDIHHFMQEFIHKNFEREQEISSLRKHLNKSLQDNLVMCQQIQQLQEYHCKLQEEIKSLSSTTSSLIVQSDALKMVPALFGIINL